MSVSKQMEQFRSSLLPSLTAYLKRLSKSTYKGKYCPFCAAATPQSPI